MPIPAWKKAQAAVGKPRAAQLLVSLNRWQKFTKVTFAGQKWVTLTREGWADELGCSVTQYDYALAHLKALRLVETEQHFFKGRCSTFLRLTTDGERVFSDSGLEGVIAKPGFGKSAKPIITEGKKTEGETVSNETVTRASARGVSGETKEEDGEEKMKKHGLTVKELSSLPKGLPTPPKAPLAHDPTGPAKLAALWQQLMAVHHPGVWVAGFTGQDHGNFKQMLASWPPGQRKAVLEAVLSKWGEFCHEAKLAAGTHTSPQQPTIAYLAKHRDFAVQFAFPIVMKVPAKKTPIPSAPVQSIAPPPQKTKMSKAELLASLENDDD